MHLSHRVPCPIKCRALPSLCFWCTAMLALALAASEPTATLSSLAPQDEGGRRSGGGGAAAPFCVHMTAHFCGRSRVRDASERGSCRQRVGEAVHVGSCKRWETEECGRLRRSARWLGIRRRRSGQSERGRGERLAGGGRSTGNLVSSGRGVDTAEQLATALLDDGEAAALARSLFWSPPLSNDDGTVHKCQCRRGGTGCLKWAAQVCQRWRRTRSRRSDSSSILYVFHQHSAQTRLLVFDTCLLFLENPP